MFALAALATYLVVQRAAETRRPASADTHIPAQALPTALATFTGSQTCATCHADQHSRWKGSQHERAMQHVDEKTVLGNFDNARFRYANVDTRFYRRDGKFFTRTDGPDGRLAEFEIKYTFGVYPLQQYLIEFTDGRLQALTIAWDSRPKAAGGQRWFHLYPDEKVDHRDELHWTKRSQNWNFMCADCHSTNLRKHYDSQTDRFKSQWSEISVGCEACHGPGSRHIEWAARKDADPTRGLSAALDERRGVAWAIDPNTGSARRSVPRTSHREIEVCAQCHARRAQIAEGYQAGKPFLDHYRPALLEPGLYHPDGQQRDEVYIWGSFLQSRMHQAGVTCSDCHEPHSQKLRAEGNAVCAQCHLPAKFDTPSHHFHKQGARCVDCHMPTTTYMVVDPRRDHSLRIPRPDLTVSLGTPNACNSCHKDKPAAWADARLRAWYDPVPQGWQRFGETLAAAERPASAAVAGAALAALAGNATQPAIARASGMAALGRFPSPASLAAIRQGLADADPLIRHASIGALAAMPPDERVPLVAPLLGDPLRGVRIEAAASLAGARDAAFDGSQRLAFEPAATEFEAVQRYNADRPEARTALGNFHAQRGRFDLAEAELKSAVLMDPPFPPAAVNLADLYRAQGRDEEAVKVLSEALGKTPQNAALYHARGLARVRLQQTAGAMTDLERAARLAPDDARFAYVYAVALHSSGEPRRALAELDRALLKAPADRDLLAAGMAFARDLGDQVLSARYAKRLGDLGGPR
jgi:Flp pilus assembly protein TadD